MDNINQNENIGQDAFLEGNECIDEAVTAFYKNPSEDTFTGILYAIYLRMMADGHFIIPVDPYEDEEGNQGFNFKTLLNENNELAVAAFTTGENFKKAPETGALSNFIDSLLVAVKGDDNISGILLNPWGETFFLTKEMIATIIDAKEKANKQN